MLDLDALAAAEGESWVWHGASVLRPTPEQLAAGEPWRHALVDLSPGGSDSDVTREFDLVDQAVRARERGRVRPRRRPRAALSWVDADTVYVFTDFGAGHDDAVGLPAAGEAVAPRHAAGRGGRRLRGHRAGHVHLRAPLAHPGLRARPGAPRDARSTPTRRTWPRTSGTPGQTLTKIDVPDSAEVGLHREWLLVELRDDWDARRHDLPAGSLLAAPPTSSWPASRDLTVLFEPTPTTSLAGTTWTRNHLVLNVLDDVKNLLHVLTPPATPARARWVRSGAARGRRAAHGRRRAPSTPSTPTTSGSSPPAT